MYVNKHRIFYVCWLNSNTQQENKDKKKILSGQNFTVGGPCFPVLVSSDVCKRSQLRQARRGQCYSTSGETGGLPTSIFASTEVCLPLFGFVFHLKIIQLKESKNKKIRLEFIQCRGLLSLSCKILFLSLYWMVLFFLRPFPIKREPKVVDFYKCLSQQLQQQKSFKGYHWPLKSNISW